MAGTTLKTHSFSGLTDSVERNLVIQLNKLVADLETLRAAYAATLAKLDADAGVTDTNYVALNTVLAASLTASKIGDESGTVISA